MAMGLSRVPERAWNADTAERLMNRRFPRRKPSDSFVAIRRDGYVHIERLLRYEKTVAKNGTVVHVFEVE